MIVALETGEVAVSVKNVSGTKSSVTKLDIKAPCLEVDQTGLLLHPDGKVANVSYGYLDLEGKKLTNLNASAFDACLLPILETKSCFKCDVASSTISMKVVSLSVDGGTLE